MRRRALGRYRSHRKAAWAALVLASVGLVAAISIPLALAAGTASGKYFTLGLQPATVCSAATPTATTTVTLKNIAGSQTLGSAQIYFPAGSIVPNGVSAPWTLASNQSNSLYFTGTKDVVSATYLGLLPGRSTQIVVTFNAGQVPSTQVTAAAKQSNTFNDTQGGANLFTLDPAQGTFPTLKVVPCVTVGGRVYEDRNFDSQFNLGGGGPGFGQSDLPKAWTVSLYQTGVGAPATPFMTTTSDSGTGLYTFANVPTGSDYKVCVAAAGADASSAWAVESLAGGVAPSNTQCGPLSATSDSTSPGNLLSGLSSDATTEDFAVNPVTAPFGPGDTNTVGGYTVTGGSGSQKSDIRYVQETWVAGGVTNFRFAPATPCAAPLNCSTIYLLETLTADIPQATLNGDQATLLYNDVPPFYDGTFKTMPYCSTDPRPSGWAPGGPLATSGVLPTVNNVQATSCIVTGTQSVNADGSVHVVYVVYSSHDGGRQLG